MAGDILDTPTDPNIDISSGFADVRGALDFVGDVDVLRIDMADRDSFSSGAWKIEGRESLKFRVLDAAGQEVQGAVSDSEGWISLVGSAKGQYALEISSPTDEVTEYQLRVSAWTAEPPTFPEVTPRPDDADEIGPDATVLDTSSDGGPDGRVPDSDAPGGDAPGGGIPDSKSTDDSDIHLELRDGIWFYGDEPTNGDKQLDGIEEPPVCPFPVGDWDGDPGAEGGNEGESEVPSKDDGGSGISLGLPTPIFARMHNAASPADVDGDDSLTPLDALVLINLLNSRGGGAVSSFAPPATAQGEALPSNSFIDTNNDGFISPLDVLLVINQLNLQSQRNSEIPVAGESEPDQTDSAYAAAVDWAFSSGEDEKDKPGLWCALPLPEWN